MYAALLSIDQQVFIKQRFRVTLVTTTRGHYSLCGVSLSAAITLCIDLRTLTSLYIPETKVKL